ncbi:hypothetical protein JCM11641_006064 [Rhodosporidiobolus odoratus]
MAPSASSLPSTDDPLQRHDPIASTSSRRIEDNTDNSPRTSQNDTPTGKVYIEQEGDIAEIPPMASGDEDGGDGIRQRRRRRGSNAPSYAQSEFFEITRRQRVRTQSNTLKLPRNLLAPSRSRSPAPYPPTVARQPSSASTTDHANPDDNGLPYSSSDKSPPKLAHAWQFAGWGSMSYLELNEEEVEKAERRREEEMKRDGEGALGPWLASGVAGVAVAGSPLYAFPALVAVASVYSPISLLVATLLLSFWRPIMTELASSLPISGANYAYLLNSSSTASWALVAAALTLLDDIATSVVAAATAASYIADQGVAGGETWLTIVLILGIALVGLVGVRGGASVTLITLGIHLATLSVLIVSAAVHWGKHGNSTLATNWTTNQLPSASAIIRSIYQGICIAFLGVTGFETAPDYITSLRPQPNIYPTVLRSLQIIAVCINAPLLLAVFAVLPVEGILGNVSVLSEVGRVSAGRWLGVLMTVDAVLILSATVLAGLISALALLQRLSLDGYLPLSLLKPMRFTGTPPFVVVLFAALCITVYTSSGNSLSVVSNMFALVFLFVMTLYPIVLLIQRYNRPTLPTSSGHPTPFLLILFTLLLSLTLLAGVIYTQPTSLGYFAAYGLAILVLILAAARIGTWVRCGWWVFEYGIGWRKGAERCVGWMKGARVGREVVLFIKGDESEWVEVGSFGPRLLTTKLCAQINTLFQRISYVARNEETDRIKLVHFYGGERSTPSAQGGRKKEEVVDGESGHPAKGRANGGETPQVGTAESGVDEIPSELEANFQILDEAFPSITIDLIFLQAPFSPRYVHALAQRLGTNVARCFMGCPSERWKEEKEFGVRELAGVRVIGD